MGVSTFTEKSGKNAQYTPEIKEHSFHTGILTPPNQTSSAPVRLNRPHFTPIGSGAEYGYLWSISSDSSHIEGLLGVIPFAGPQKNNYFQPGMVLFPAFCG